MTVPVSTSRSSYVGNGVTTAFGAGFYFLAASEVVVRLTPSGGVEVIQVLGVHYTVTMPASVGANGSITMLTPPPAGAALVVERTVPYVQGASFRTQGSFSPAVHEDAMDELEFQLQQLARRTSDLESAGAPGSVVAGNGLAFAGSTLHVGAGAGIQSNADTVEVLFGGAPSDIYNGAANGGAAATASRSDHSHGVIVGAPSALSVGSIGGSGAGLGLALADHLHAIPTGVPGPATTGVSTEGTSALFARLDHHHQVATGVTVDLTDATNAEGVGDRLAREDHTHAHGARGGDTLHALATTALAGFMSAADKVAIGYAPTETTLTTADATPTVIATVTPTNTKAETVKVTITGKDKATANSASYGLAFLMKRHAGVTTLTGAVGAMWTAIEDVVGWDATVVVVTPDVQIKVTGAAGTNIDWRCRIERVVSG